MIQILTVNDPQEKEMLCEKAGVKFSSDLHIIALYDQSEKLEQGAIFRYSGTNGEIVWLDMGTDADFAEGLGKAILSIMEIRGVETVTLPLCYDDLAKRLRFTKNESEYVVSLKGYFCCNCNHK